MPKKISTAVAGSLAVGLTLPLQTGVAHAATSPAPPTVPGAPGHGSLASTMSLAELLDGVDVSADAATPAPVTTAAVPASNAPTTGDGEVASAPEPGLHQPTTFLNARTGPSMDAEVAFVLEPDELVQVTGEEQGWAAIDHDGETLYVGPRYLKPAAAEATTWLNLRGGPGMSHEVLRVLDPGFPMQVLSGPEDGWYELTVAGQTGWAYGEYLFFGAGSAQSVGGADAEAPAEAPASEEAAESGGDAETSSHSLDDYLPGTRGLVEQLAAQEGLSPEALFQQLLADPDVLDDDGVLDHAALQARLPEAEPAGEPDPGPAEEPAPEQANVADKPAEKPEAEPDSEPAADPAAEDEAEAPDAEEEGSQGSLDDYLPGTRGLVEQLAQLEETEAQRLFDELMADDAFLDEDGLL
ncbi:SH3 domain-containing protein, partial [Nesterenkonia sp. PF2B19]|uniref:SH3 domain-containing protein n=1 Tax=Nesterenkonia sp. PF2B19 TaxID=1881858 RepID=UPI000A23D7B7